MRLCSSISVAIFPSQTFVTGPVIVADRSFSRLIRRDPPGMWTLTSDPQRPSLWATAAAAVALLPKLELAPMITHRFTFGDAARAFALIDTHPEEALQVILEYDAASSRT